MKRGLLGSLAVLVVLAAPASAGAATQIGQTSDPSASSCAGNLTWLQTASAGNAYVVPSPGVLSSWSYLGGNDPPPQIRFKVGRPAGGTLFTIIGQSPFESPLASQQNTYANIRIPVQAGDVIGLHIPGANFDCAFTSSAPDTLQVVVGDVGPGSTADFRQADIEHEVIARLDVSATLEPDCDNDGFGDETQDQDVASCPPETEITKRPADKSKKPKAKFKFTSDDPGATFECKLKGKGLDQEVKQFGDCDSPRKYKRLDDGKFKFQVRAIDSAGNVDPTPAKDKFKVVD